MFERVYGHARIKLILERMVQKGAIPHALCFFGPTGIGKRLLARELAKALMCETHNACGTCGHCRKLEHGNHPDYGEITPMGTDIRVEQIREISDNLHYRPFEARARVIVLDQAERMREGAANAFLKSLEEPPAYVFFVLICTDIKMLLPTIRSRCQKIAFQSLNLADKTSILQTRFGKDEAEARRLAGISFRQLETEAEAWDLFKKDVLAILKFCQMMLSGGHALDYLAEQLRDKAGYDRFMSHLFAVFRELARLAYHLPSQEIFTGWEAEMRPLAGQCPPAEWRAMIEQLLILSGGRRRNLNASMWFNSLSVNGLGLLESSAREVRQRLARVR